jgi:hypothetical protein
MSALARIVQAFCDSYAFIVADDPRLSSVDESPESGSAFPEGGSALEDVVMYHAADILCERNTDWRANAFSAARYSGGTRTFNLLHALIFRPALLPLNATAYADFTSH